MADAITIDNAKAHLEAVIDGCLTADMEPAEIHELILNVLYEADIPLPAVADGPCVHCGAWTFAHTPEGWANLVQERCHRCGLHRW